MLLSGYLNLDTTGKMMNVGLNVSRQTFPMGMNTLETLRD